jgi:hypothetical protein
MLRRTLVTRIGVGLSSLVLVGTGAASASAHTAQRTTTCTNQGCQGQFADPTGCSKDARNIRSVPITNLSTGKVVGWVDLRWSPTCGNNWARTRSAVGNATLTAKATRHDGKTAVNAGNGSWIGTTMIFGRDQCVMASGSVNGASASTPCA